MTPAEMDEACSRARVSLESHSLDCDCGWCSVARALLVAVGERDAYKPAALATREAHDQRDTATARAIIAGAGVKGPFTTGDADVYDAYDMSILAEDGGFWSIQIAENVALALNTLPAALDEVERLRAELRHERRSLDAVREEMAVDTAELATLRSALVEACDEIDHLRGYDSTARLRALAAGATP